MDLLANADCVTLDARGATSILGREVRLPVSAEMCVLNEKDMARIMIQVNAGSGKDTVSHRAVADNRPLILRGTCKLQLRESYKDAAAYVEHLIGEVRRDMLEFLARELRKEEAKITHSKGDN
jgi:hypothetical protein